MTDLITMDGEYAYEVFPNKKVRILCVDGPSKYFPVISVDANGCLFQHGDTGNERITGGFNLIPLQHKPREVWGIVYSSGGVNTYQTREAAKRAADRTTGVCDKIIHFREVMPDDPA